MSNYYYSAPIGGFVADAEQPRERKYTIVQSLWTKPIKDKAKLRDTMFIAALSLYYAHRSGYKVNMHTDSKGYELLKDFGYEGLYKTLDQIPDSVHPDMFAAGKFFAMKEEGFVGKVHIDTDVFIKKPVLDKFYEDITIDAICQMEEDMTKIDHSDFIMHMFVLGYPSTTRPNWYGSMNTGVVGFNSAELAAKYYKNYYDGLQMYTAEKINKYKAEGGYEYLMFDFILEQIQLSYLSVGYRVCPLIPTKNCCEVADAIGYQHLQGNIKWKSTTRAKIRKLLMTMDKELYNIAHRAAVRAWGQG